MAVGGNAGGAGGAKNLNRAQRPMKKVKPPAPTPTQIKSARTQEQAYTSQGQAVKKVAKQQRATAKVKRLTVPERAYKSQGQAVQSAAADQRYNAQKRPGLHLSAGGVRKVAAKQGLKQITDTGKLAQEVGQTTRIKRAEAAARGVAPILTVLNQTTRPLHAVAGGVDAAVTGKSIPKAALRGIENKDHTTFSKVLKDVGVKNKTVRTVAGLAGDIALDPLTYVNLEGKGAQIAATKIGQKVGTTAPARALKAVARDVSPHIPAAGVSKAAHQEATSAARTTRSTMSAKVHEIGNTAMAIRHALGKNREHDQQVFDAAESNKIHQLPPHLQVPAKLIRKHLDELHHLEQAHGITHEYVPHYIPHYTNESLKARAPSEFATVQAGKRTIKLGEQQHRRPGTLAELRKSHPGVYNEDLAVAYYNRMTAGHRAVYQSQLNQRLAGKLGRPAVAGAKLDPEKEGVFLLKGSDLNEVTDQGIVQKILSGQYKGHGRAVILNRDVVKKAHAVTSPGKNEKYAFERVYDRATHAFKWGATQPNPGFHIRNLIGDTQNMYLGTAGRKIPANVYRSARGLRELNKQEIAQRTLGKAPHQTKAGTKIGGQHMTYGELASEAQKVGAVRAGFTGRELSDLLRQDERGVKSIRPGGKLSIANHARKRAFQNREDLNRLAMYIERRKAGENPEAAAQHVANFLFDYGNVTEFERRVARRVMPFYTFSARNIPRQAKSLVARPGKFANYQKVREEAGNAIGAPPGWEGQQTPYQQRQAGIPVKWKGHSFSVSASLPLTDLNEIPGAAGAKQLGEYFDKGASLVTPILKDPAEFYYNYSSFFKGPIRDSHHPLVAAPDGVGKLPGWLKHRLHVARIQDKKTGKMVWAWDAKADYVAHAALPGLGSTALGLASTGANKQGQGTGAKALKLAGISSIPIDASSSEIQHLRQDITSLQDKLTILSQRGIKGADNPQRKPLNAKVRADNAKIQQLEQKRGDKILSGRQKKSGNGWGGSSGSGGGWGGSSSGKNGWG